MNNQHQLVRYMFARKVQVYIHRLYWLYVRSKSSCCWSKRTQQEYLERLIPNINDVCTHQWTINSVGRLGCRLRAINMQVFAYMFVSCLFLVYLPETHDERWLIYM